MNRSDALIKIPLAIAGLAWSVQVGASETSIRRYSLDWDDKGYWCRDASGQTGLNELLLPELLATRLGECARLEARNLSGTDLVSARLGGANLSGSILVRADLRGSDMPWANLSRADLTEAKLGGLDIPDSPVPGSYRQTYMYRAKLDAAVLRSADLSGAELSHASMEGAIVDQADLRGASLIAANLDGASLRQARLEAADLRRALVRGVSWTGATYNQYTTLPFSREEATRLGLVFVPFR